MTPRTARPRRAIATVDVVLYVVALLLACGVVVGGVVIVRDRDGDAGAAPGSDVGGETVDEGAAEPLTEEQQDRYGEVLTAARATAQALINIDYRRPDDSFDAVAATATGTFLDQYRASSQSLVRLVRTYKSVLEGSVVTAAVSDVDADSATVLVATEGTVSNAQTEGDAQVRNFRLLVRLVERDGAWLTNDLEFVG